MTSHERLVEAIKAARCAEGLTTDDDLARWAAEKILKYRTPADILETLP